MVGRAAVPATGGVRGLSRTAKKTVCLATLVKRAQDRVRIKLRDKWGVTRELATRIVANCRVITALSRSSGLSRFSIEA